MFFHVNIIHSVRRTDGKNALLLQQPDHEAILHFQTASLELRSQEAIPWTLDGEFGGETKKVRIADCPQALPVLVSWAQQ